MFYSTWLRLVEQNIQSFTLMKYLYHRTNNYSLFALFIEVLFHAVVAFDYRCVCLNNLRNHCFCIRHTAAMIAIDIWLLMNTNMYILHEVIVWSIRYTQNAIIRVYLNNGGGGCSPNSKYRPDIILSGHVLILYIHRGSYSIVKFHIKHHTKANHFNPSEKRMTG